MCGKFMFRSSLEEVKNQYKIEKSLIKDFHFNREDRYPGEEQVIVRGSKTRQVELMKWGFPFSWAKNKIINVRCESLEKGLFKESFLLRRVIIPANGYIEWKKDSNTKQAYIFKEKNNKVLSLGGIFNRFRNEAGIWEEYFSIITVPSSESAVNIHHRMPLIVNGYEDIFLSKYIEKETLFQIFRNNVSLKCAKFS